MSGGGLWNDPTDAIAGSVLTAAFWNTEVGSNLEALTQSTTTITTTGSQGALAIPQGHGDLILFLNNGSLLTIHGIEEGYDGQTLALYAIGAGQVDVPNQSGSASSAINRVINGVTGTRSLAAGGSMSLKYDASVTRWRVITHEQGAWITPTFDAAHFTANGAMTWTVASGDRTQMRYYLRGRTLTVSFTINTTSVGGVVSSGLIISNGQYGGFTAAAVDVNACSALDNGAASECMAQNGNTSITLFRGLATPDWTLSTDLTYVRGQLTLELS